MYSNASNNAGTRSLEQKRWKTKSVTDYCGPEDTSEWEHLQAEEESEGQHHEMIFLFDF
jgi:hypothetical protein